ncbi:tyrosine-type recombinase/integrase [Tranquillimonas alkanivorans]|uniref:Phage integrase family protein n=1 Tax=Tranquillimonas alkanivorans TaxID=441119 RepID=A0A1I5RXG8_9RHOB|nr:site-specific integrase [Tranquillimonas alkanivorans]SFP63097.1 Phage integrase family protein [Tranquillimonas alkanivorans]
MPKRARELTPGQIKGLRHPGGERPVKIAVGGVAGLHIQIQPSGAKSWILRGRFGDWMERKDSNGRVIDRGRKKREIGLGPYPEILPGPARDRAREMKEKLRQGVDPVQERKEAHAALMRAARRGVTFQQAMEEYAVEKLVELSSDAQRIAWRRMMANHVTPVIGSMLVSDVQVDDVLRVLRPIWSTKTVTAVKVRQRIEKVLSFAKVREYREGENPARWDDNLNMLLGRPSQVSQERHYPAVQLKDTARCFGALRAREGIGGRAVEFQAMTATRSGAVRFATWDEFDFETRLWTIQPGRKAAKIKPGEQPKRIPLTDEMIALLQALPRLAGCPFVFWSSRGTALSDATLGKHMKVIAAADKEQGGNGFADAATGQPAVPHGFRSTFRTWVTERTEFPGDMAEVALWHKVGNKVQQAYDRGDMVERRRRMMSAWYDFLCGRPSNANVVPFEALRA